MVTIDEAMASCDSQLMGYLVTLMDSYDDATDLFDEVYTRFCEAFEAGAEFATLLKARAWLFKVARNAALRKLEHIKREPTNGLMDELGTQCRRLSAVESSVDLHRAMSRLPQPLRDLFAVVVTGVSAAEAGRRLGVSERCAQYRYALAAQIVRSALVEIIPQSRAHDEFTRQGRVSYHPTVTTINESSRWGEPLTR